MTSLKGKGNNMQMSPIRKCRQNANVAKVLMFLNPNITKPQILPKHSKVGYELQENKILVSLFYLNFLLCCSYFVWTLLLLTVWNVDLSGQFQFSYKVQQKIQVVCKHKQIFALEYVTFLYCTLLYKLQCTALYYNTITLLCTSLPCRQSHLESIIELEVPHRRFSLMLCMVPLKRWMVTENVLTVLFGNQVWSKFLM